MSDTFKFKALLESDDSTTGTFLQIPFDVPKTFGSRARVPVRGTINGFPFRSSLFPMGGKFLLGVNRTLRESARVCAGDLVDVELARDTEPRIMEPTPDLAAALRGDDVAQAAWCRLSYSHKKEFVLAIEEAKKPETRARRVAKAIEELRAKKK